MTSIYNFIYFNMLTLEVWSKILKKISIDQFSDLECPELFLVFFPLIIDGFVARKHIVSTFARVNGDILMNPIGIVSAEDHPMDDARIESSGSDGEYVPANCMCLATGRLADSSLCLTSIQLTMSFDETEVYLPNRINEAGKALYQIFAELNYGDSGYRHAFIENMGCRQMSTQLKQSDEQAAISSIASKFRKADFE